MVKKDETILSDKSSNKTSGLGTAAEKIVKGARSKVKGTIQDNEIGNRQKQLEEHLRGQMELFYRPEAFRGLVRAPADIAMAMTGSKRFDLSKEEIETLSINAAMTTQLFGVVNPKWMALTLFSLSILTIYGTRTSLYFLDKRQEKKSKEEIK